MLNLTCKNRKPKASHPWKQAAFLAAEAKAANAENKARDDAGRQKIVGIYARMGVRV